MKVTCYGSPTVYVRDGWTDAFYCVYVRDSWTDAFYCVYVRDGWTDAFYCVYVRDGWTDAFYCVYVRNGWTDACSRHISTQTTACQKTTYRQDDCSVAALCGRTLSCQTLQ